MLTGLIFAAAAAVPQCAALDQELPKELSAWAKPSPANATLVPGSAYILPLRPSPVPEGKAAKVGTFGGFVPLKISRPGSYGVALGDRGWIDLTRGKEPALKSTSHGHGPPCSTIRKIVNFDLKPGNYMLQISESPVASVRVLVIRR